METVNVASVSNTVPVTERPRTLIEMLHEERNQLLVRLRKLGDFIDSQQFDILEDIEKEAMRAQYDAMCTYNRVLMLRTSLAERESQLNNKDADPYQISTFNSDLSVNNHGG